MNESAPASATTGPMSGQFQPGVLTLQQCDACGAVQYPQREVCVQCLSDRLAWRALAGGGKVLAVSALHHSLQPRFAADLPWLLGSVALDIGPVVLVRITDPALGGGQRVKVAWQRQGDGEWLLEAVPNQGENA